MYFHTDPKKCHTDQLENPLHLQPITQWLIRSPGILEAHRQVARMHTFLGGFHRWSSWNALENPQILSLHAGDVFVRLLVQEKLTCESICQAVSSYIIVFLLELHGLLSFEGLILGAGPRGWPSDFASAAWDVVITCNYHTPSKLMSPPRSPLRTPGLGLLSLSLDYLWLLGSLLGALLQYISGIMGMGLGNRNKSQEHPSSTTVHRPRLHIFHLLQSTRQGAFFLTRAGKPWQMVPRKGQGNVWTSPSLPLLIFSYWTWDCPWFFSMHQGSGHIL